jgi:hypothetical protein
MQRIPPVTDRQLLNVLEARLGDLAARWRGTQDQDAAEALVRQYQAILLWMIELGYRDALDVESELPNAYMPAEYWALRTV